MAVAFHESVLGTSSAAATTATVGLSAFTAGDLCLVFISRGSNTGPNSVPANWTLAVSEVTTGAGVWLYWKTLAAGDLTDVSWGWAASSKMIMHAVAYSGAHATAPIGGYNAAVNDTSSNTVPVGSLNSNELMLVAAGSAYATTAKTFSSPDYTERVDYGHTSPDFWQFVYDSDGAWGGGSSNPTILLSASATSRRGVHVSLVPASGDSPATGFMTTNSKFWG
jgi:hypothetical protein